MDIQQGTAAIPALTALGRRQARLRQSLHEADSADGCENIDGGIVSSNLVSSSNFDLAFKRRDANARERLRVRNLNSGFAKLRRILPTVPPNRKPSKVDTLQGAIDYMYQLEKLLESTGGIPNIKKKLGTIPHSHSRQSVTERPFFIDDITICRNQIRYPAPLRRGSEPRLMMMEFKDNDIRPHSQVYPELNHIPMHNTDPHLANGRSIAGIDIPSPTSSSSSEDTSRRYYTDNLDYMVPTVPPSRSSSEFTLPTHSVSLIHRSEKSEFIFKLRSSSWSEASDDIYSGIEVPTGFHQSYIENGRRWIKDDGFLPSVPYMYMNGMAHVDA